MRDTVEREELELEREETLPDDELREEELLDDPLEMEPLLLEMRRMMLLMAEVGFLAVLEVEPFLTLTEDEEG